MKILKTSEEFEKEIKKILKLKPTYIYISTFNIYINELIDHLIKFDCKNKKIIVGLADTSKVDTKELIKHCTKNNVNIKLSKNHHTKLFVTDKGAIIGGRNFTGSNWTDLSFVINKPSNLLKLKNEFTAQFNNIKKDKKFKL